jgi:TolA-binding protein
MNISRCLSLIAVTALLSGSLQLAHAQQLSQSEALARRQFQSGLAFLAEGRYEEALKDFQAVLDAHPDSSVADDALLAIATYHLEVAADLDTAQASVDLLLRSYASGDAASMGHIVAGRIILGRSRAAADVETALASFERVRRLFPDSEAVPAALYYAGEALDSVRRTEEALERYGEVTGEYPGSVWAARSLISTAVCLVQAGKPLRAMESLQRIRQRFSGSLEAEHALKLNTILYRLYVRAPAHPPFAVTGRTIAGAGGKLKDVLAVGFDPSDRLVVVNKNATLLFDTGGTAVRSLAGTAPKGLLFDRSGRPVVLLRGAMQPDQAQAVGLSIPRPDGTSRQLEDVISGVVLSSGDFVLPDRSGKALVRFTADGKHRGNFAAVDALRVAVNRLDDVAVLDRSGKNIVIFDRDGKTRGRLVQRGKGYEFGDVVDIAFDRFGHLYALDPNRGSVFIFMPGPETRLIATFALADRTQGSFRRASAFALDSAGRLYIHDERAESVQVYR